MDDLTVGRAKKAVQNYLSSIALTAVTFLTAMISSRIVIRYIGDDRFGAFRSLLELFGFLNLIDVGISSSLRPLLAKAVGTDQTSEISKIMQTAYQLFRYALLLSIILGIMISLFCYLIIPVPIQIRLDLQVASLVFCFGMLNILISPSRCFCETVQKLSIVNSLLIFQSLSVTVTSVVFCRLFPGWGITVLSSSLTFWIFIFNTILYLRMRKITDTLIVNENHQKSEKLRLRELIKHGRDNFILMLAGRASLHSNNLIVGLFYGQSDVTKLYATQRLFDVIQTQLFGVGNASWAALAQIYHQERLDLFRTRVLQLLKLIMILGLSVVVPLVFQNKLFVSLWLGSERYGGDTLTIILVFLTIGLGFSVFSTWCLMSTGHIHAILRLSVITAILDVIATFIFTKSFGLIGPALGSCIVIFFITIPWHCILLKKHFGIQFVSIINTYKPSILTLPVYILINFLIAGKFATNSIFMLAQIIFWPALLFLLFHLTLSSSKDQRRQIISRIWIKK